jgi:hypothetical protein
MVRANTELAATLTAEPLRIEVTRRNGTAEAARSSPMPWLTLLATSSPRLWMRSSWSIMLAP